MVQMIKTIDLFVEILCGDLDNREQISAEQKNGKQIHPYAKHITRLCGHMIKNIPENHQGLYILEESYYQYPNQEMEIKPLFFYIREQGDTILLQSIVIPEHMDKSKVVNSNPDLCFDYNELKINEKFGTAHYTRQENTHFTAHHKCDFGDGLSFALIETLSKDGLWVMELLIKDGVQLTPYDTPLEYKKYQNEIR